MSSGGPEYVRVEDRNGKALWVGRISEWRIDVNSMRQPEFTIRGVYRLVSGAASTPAPAPAPVISCECGAHKSMGAGPQDSGHSTWCPWARK